MNISNLVLPLIILIIIVYALYKKVDIFDVFIDGVKEGLEMSLKIFPTIFAMIISVSVFLKSNIIFDFTKYLDKIFNYLYIPIQIIPLAILKPISGSASLIVMNDILKTNGPDTYVGMLASVIQGSTDTTIYILSLYFASVGIKNIRYALKIGLLADLITIIVAIIIVNILF